MIDEQDKMEYDGCLFKSYRSDDLSSPVDIVIKEYINQEIYIYTQVPIIISIYASPPGLVLEGTLKT